MNLNSLFSRQAKLDNYIIKEKELEGKDLLPRKTVALIAELYECVNEAEFFKFWKENPKPRNYDVQCHACGGSGMIEIGIAKFEVCEYCEGTGIRIRNPMLIEYVDMIHFLVGVANDLGYTSHKYTAPKPMDLNELTLGITNIASTLHKFRTKKHIETLFNYVILLGYQLGFDEKMVIEAYHEKNKENYERQQNGY